MLIFIDESWQTLDPAGKKVCVLSAVAINDNDFNEYSRNIWNLKTKHLGPKCGDIEIKGKDIFKNYNFRLEAKGIISRELSLARDILRYGIDHGAKAFASIVFDQEQVQLDCADEKLLERPFLFLFERINLFMQEKHPDSMAALIFDDRNLGQNERISASVSNFFHLSRAGKAFDRIIKVPFFAISSENVGIQLADMVAYLVGKETTQDKKVVADLWKEVKKMEFISITERDGDDGKKHTTYGFKPIKQKEAGNLNNQKG